MMNIREAAMQLEQAARAYGARTPDGAYRIALASQRPVYLIGPPGVGKTAVVAQVAAKLGIGYVACTMTHHTRQSALGLPIIVHRTLNGQDRATTEYTVSEIVASVWEKAAQGAETGILFLDEINCVSESLMPAMLQLLQYKTFGLHALPRGWMIVCAGNPPKYNRYAHTFDAVVMDRLRVIEVEPDFDAWRAFARERSAHPAIRSYLDLRREDFYVTDGDRIVTARSWTDLSDMLLAMEAEGLAPGEDLFSQYLQVEEVSRRFALYFRICADIGVGLREALEDGAPQRLSGLPLDESVFAALLLAGSIEAQAGEVHRVRREAERLQYFADGVMREAEQRDSAVEALSAEHLNRQRQALTVKRSMGIVSEEAEAREAALLRRIEGVVSELHGKTDEEAARLLQARADDEARCASALEASLISTCEQNFDFIERAFPNPNARLILLTDLHDHEDMGYFLKKHLKARFDALFRACDPDART